MFFIGVKREEEDVELATQVAKHCRQFSLHAPEIVEARETVTQEQVDDFKTLIDGATPGGAYDTDIQEIIQDEAGAYFAGDKTADEVAKLIQSRVSIYLGETS